MKTADVLPVDYVPFNELIVCSNKLIKGTKPFEIEGKIPLLVGKGVVPLIWLSLPSNKDISDWSPIVIANISLKPNIKVVNISDKRINISFETYSIIDVIVLASETAEVLQLDLRPFGLDIHGDTQSLYVGKNRLSHNTFSDVNVMIGIGSKFVPPGR